MTCDEQCSYLYYLKKFQVLTVPEQKSQYDVYTGLYGTQFSRVDIGPGGRFLALDTGIDTGTQFSLGKPTPGFESKIPFFT